MAMKFLELLCMVVMASHLAICPFSKVEESFNLQAMHDIIFHKTNVSQYDHHEFPGVVPRSFLGPLFISLLSFPAVYLSIEAAFTKMAAQYIVRFILGLTVAYTFIKFKRSVSARLGHGVGRWLLLISCTQFHLMFYMSRSLPNTFALGLTLLALHYWLREKTRAFIWAAASAILIFRAEVSLLLGFFLLSDLINRKIGIFSFIITAVSSTSFWLGLTVLVDSYFWQHTLWPEGQVLWFNVILNKSSQWGTSPYPWYFYSALPRALGASLLFIPIGLRLDTRCRTFFYPALGFLLLFSFLPHKELRFIVYVFPLFNTIAAIACNRFWQNKKKSLARFFLAIVALGHLAVNLGLTAQLLYVSHVNYPGGEAMAKIHDVVPSNSVVNMHIDVAAAQTGVSRFTQLNSNWSYDKSEDLKLFSLASYSHLLVGDAKQVQALKNTHKTLAVVKGFSHLQFRGRDFPPLAVIQEDKIFVLQKK